MIRALRARRKAAASARRVIATRYGDGRSIAAQPFQPAVTVRQAPEGAANLSFANLLTLPRAPFAVRALNNMSFGATAQSIGQFNALGGTDAQRLANWVDWQLDWRAIDDGALEQRLSAHGYTTLGKSLTQLWAEHVVPDPAYNVRMRPAFETQRAAFVRATHSRRQLREVMAHFWHDHFNVTAGDFSAGPVYVHYDRDVIRAHALGNFRAMLEAVATSPAMLYYLDNVSNTRAGPNENWARELLELHTLGAEHYLGFMDPFQVPPDAVDAGYPAGYTDIDVYETAAAFTGWSMKNAHWQYPADNDGTFVYRQAWHDAGPKFVLGRLLNPEQPAMKDGRDVLDRLASHPAVARHVCGKLIRRFIDDAPPPALVASAAAVFRAHWQSADQMVHVLRHVLNSDALYNAWGQKNRRPFEAVVAAFRAGGSDFTMRLDHARSNDFMWLFGMTGHEPHAWPAPNGYPDTAQAWSGANAYAMGWRLMAWLSEADDNGVRLLPVLELSRSELGTANWTATRLVDYWCHRLLGYQPTTQRRDELIAFLAQNGNPTTTVILDDDAWRGKTNLVQHYNHQRIRSMVALLLMTPEFLSR